MPQSIIAKRGSLWSTVYTQLFANILFAVAIPYAIRVLTLEVPADIRMVNTTAMGSIVAITMSVWLIRNIFVYPGAELGSHIIPSIFVSFGSILLFFFLSRLEYSRALLITSLFISLMWMMFVSIRAQGAQRLSIGILPFGKAAEICAIRGVSWQLIDRLDTDVRAFDTIVTDLRADLPDEWDRCVADYALSGFPVVHYKHLMESLTGQVQLEHLYENSAGSLSPQRVYMNSKHVIDWLGALIAGLLLLPVLILIAVLVAIDSPGPVLFRQERIGYRGRPFRVFKFRTMRHQPLVSDPLSSAMTQSDDVRITRIGRFLRQSRIDELPQILNILKGEMSWIGPRPEAMPLSRWYEQDIPFYRYRHIVRPGISGWAQVNQGHVTDVADVRTKLHYDFYYIKNYSPWIDLLIVTKTIVTMVSGHGAK